jgi:hypothetical protein
MLFLKFLSGLFAITFFAALMWVSFINQKTKNFKRFMKEGDPVDFYIDEIRVQGKILEIRENGVLIEYKDLALYYRTFSNTYPVLNHKYSLI